MMGTATPQPAVVAHLPHNSMSGLASCISCFNLEPLTAESLHHATENMTHNQFKIVWHGRGTAAACLCGTPPSTPMSGLAR